MAINYNGDISVVLDFQHRTPGNLRAFVQATLRSIRTGKASDVRFSSTEKIEPVPMMTNKMEYSYKDGADYVFTNPENYETVTLAAELVGEAKDFLVENATVTVTFVEEKAVSVEIPASVILTAKDSAAGQRCSGKQRCCFCPAGQVSDRPKQNAADGDAHKVLSKPGGVFRCELKHGHNHQGHSGQHDATPGHEAPAQVQVGHLQHRPIE